MNHIHIQYQKTRIGEIIMGSFEDKLCLLDYRYRKRRLQIDNRIMKGLKADYIEKDDHILSRTRLQLDEYLCGRRSEFTIPLQMVGSEFHERVWNTLLKISHGSTSTYLQLAKDIGNEKAVRAVASANGANCISIIIPCHRIIGSDGKLVGYAGGISVKKRLLKLESNYDLLANHLK